MFQTKQHHFGSILILEDFRSSASVCYGRSSNNFGNLQGFDRTPSLNGRSQHKSCVISVYMSTTLHIKTWSDGVICGCVASDHKGKELLDKEPYQWAELGHTTSFRRRRSYLV